MQIAFLHNLCANFALFAVKSFSPAVKLRMTADLSFSFPGKATVNGRNGNVTSIDFGQSSASPRWREPDKIRLAFRDRLWPCLAVDALAFQLLESPHD